MSEASDYPRKQFSDWSETTVVAQVPTVVASDPAHVEQLCNQAVSQGMKVRALGHHHNWSPLILPTHSPPNPNVLLVDTANLKGGSNPTTAGNLLHATFGAGTTLEDATAYLEQQGNGGISPAPGYSFLNMPTPGQLSLGGILAIGGHGTSVPVSGIAEPALMGCLSNLIVSFKAVTTDPHDPNSKTYAIRSFDRADPDAPAFLTHLGRAFVTEYTLAAVPNYYLQLTNQFPPMAELMAPPDAQLAGSLSSLLGQYGRVEAIWFPYATEAWVQCVERLAQKPANPVTGPYNYRWMNGITWWESEAIKIALYAEPWLIKEGSKVEEIWTRANEQASIAGTARDLEIYLTDDTLRMGIMGYALQLPRQEVQRVAYEFYQGFTTLLHQYNAKNVWPVNGAVEIRCTTLDDPTDLGIAGALPPALSVTHGLNKADINDDMVVLWLDVLAFPDSPGSSEFFADFEKQMIPMWDARYPNRVRPEWSKGWAYTKAGPWTNTDMISKWVPKVYEAATDTLTFSWAKQTLANYDRANIFTNDWLKLLFG